MALLFSKILSPLAPSVYYYVTNVDTSVGQGFTTVAVSDVKACLRKIRHYERDVHTQIIHTIILAVNHFSQAAAQYKSAQEVHVRGRNVLFKRTRQDN
jgi:hypothetical protein